MAEYKIRSSIDYDFQIIEDILNDIQTSGKFILKSSNGTDYFCSLCNHIIAHSPSDKKFRFNLWTHINEDIHRENVRKVSNNIKTNEESKQSQEDKKLIHSALESFELSKQEKSMSSKQFIINNNEGNSYRCTLCDDELLHTSNSVEFRFKLLAHINEKGHKFKLTTAYKISNDKMKTKGNKNTKKAGIKSCDQSKEEESELLRGKAQVQFSDKKSADENWDENEEEGAGFHVSKSQVGAEILKQWGNMTLDEVQNSNFKARMKKQFVEKIEKEKKKTKKIKVDLSDELNDLFDSLDQSNPVTVISKYFITKANNEKDYNCTLCDVEILYPLNSNEFRFNFWSHINDKNHRKKLPNYSDIVKSFQKEKENISKSLPAAYKADADFFELGVHFRFATCSLCNVAVSLNFYRLTNHIKGKEHTELRRNKMLRQEHKKDAKVCSKRELNVLRPKIDGNFSKDMKFIQPGEMPGYVVCIVCCRVVLPTKHYLESHFEQECHVKYRSIRPVNKSSMNLDSLMQNIPSDLKGFKSMFVEDKCGVKCSRCHEVIPATTHDLYSHIVEERKNEKEC